MEEFLKNYIDGVEPSMDFASKETYVNSFDSLTSFIITIGGTLSMIIGITGIAIFVNSVLTSILTRKKEFAMLQSIGMTGKQLKRMLSFESLYYAVGTAFPTEEIICFQRAVQRPQKIYRARFGIRNGPCVIELMSMLSRYASKRVITA